MAATDAASDMDQLLKVDWQAIFSPQHSLLDLFLRGTIMYLVIFVLLRMVVRRQTGGIGLVIVLIAEVAGNGISDNFQSVIESTVLAGGLPRRQGGLQGSRRPASASSGVTGNNLAPAAAGSDHPGHSFRRIP